MATSHETSLADTYWQEVATHRGPLEHLLHRHYPDADRQDCEDAVSEAMLRVVQRLPVDNIRAYVFQVSRTLLRTQHAETGLQTRVRPGLLVPGLTAHASPAAQVMAAHDSRYYLACLGPVARARLLATLEEPDAVYATRAHQGLQAVKTGNTRARRKLRALRHQEETWAPNEEGR